MMPDRIVVSREDELVRALVDAVRHLDFTEGAAGGDALEAFALCTDSSMSSLVACGAPSGWMQEHPELEFWTPDWPLDDGCGTEFELASDILESRYREALVGAPVDQFGVEDVTEHMHASFASMTTALEVLRETGVFSSHIILFATSSDPDDRFLKWASDSVLRLNGKQILERWNRFWKVG